MQLRNKQTGFAMIEIMVTVVIIAIAISGMGLLLLRAVQGTQDSAQLSQGMWIVQDYVGRIRANPDGAKGGFYVMDSNDINCTPPPTLLCAATYKQTSGVGTTGSPFPAADCSVNPSVNPMAVYDNWMATCSLHSGLSGLYDSPSNFIASKRLVSECIRPSSRVSTVTNQPECVEYKITLSWKTKQRRESSDSDERTYDNEYSAIVGLN